MSFLIKQAYAATDSAGPASTAPAPQITATTSVPDTLNTLPGTDAPTGDSTFSIVMMLAMVVVFYLLLWRPQSKRAKEHRNLIENLQKGDEIVTSGGIFGKITQIDEKSLKISVSEGVEIQLQRAAISAVLPKGTIK